MKWIGNTFSYSRHTAGVDKSSFKSVILGGVCGNGNKILSSTRGESVILLEQPIQDIFVESQS